MKSKKGFQKLIKFLAGKKRIIYGGIMETLLSSLGGLVDIIGFILCLLAIGWFLGK